MKLYNFLFGEQTQKCPLCEGTGMNFGLCDRCDGAGILLPQCQSRIQWGKQTCKAPARFVSPEKINGKIVLSPRCTDCAKPYFRDHDPNMQEKYPRTPEAVAYMND